jgi:phosphatidylglycerophosphate synthase
MQAFSAMRKAGDSNQGRRRALRHADPSFIPIVLGVAFAAAAAQRALAIDEPYAAAVSIASVAGAGVVLRLASVHLADGILGIANRVTLVRGALAALAAGLLLAEPRRERAWFAVAVIAAALALDGVDGALARRRGLTTPFGARFDMETDALTILILCALAWRFERAGAWVMLGGLLRYAFVAAGSVWPWLRRPLPPSRRRQTACVVQIGALIACLAPVAPPRVAGSIAALGLAGLAVSFAADILWLGRVRNGPKPPSSPGPSALLTPSASLPPTASFAPQASPASAASPAPPAGTVAS